MNARMPIVTIDSGIRWSYFQWFLLGFNQLQNDGELVLRRSVDPLSELLFRVGSDSVAFSIARMQKRLLSDTYCMMGRIELPGGRERVFCIDSADSPFLFNSTVLDRCDVYFKMQCPKDLDAGGFPLSSTIEVPWCDHAHADGSLSLTDRAPRKRIELTPKRRSKIRPLMIGPRRLSRSNKVDSLQAGYDKRASSFKGSKAERLMCYFGDSDGPTPIVPVGEPDYDSEANLMGFFGNQVEHPNRKRAIVADYIDGLGAGCDGRVIHRGRSDSGKHIGGAAIPLSEFCEHISKFGYNFNVSGYRRSIPNRFCESFIVGTAVVTDALAVRWYAPFGEEVIETVEMGYLPGNEVDWPSFREDVNKLSTASPEVIRRRFEDLWSPRAVVRYMLSELGFEAAGL